MSDAASRPPLVVLVHGAWHGAWCWAPFQAELDRRGIPSMAIDLPGHGLSTEPLGDLHGDAAALNRSLDALDSRAGRSTDGVVLVGHSYGGAVITEAAARRDDVQHLLYVAAFALQAEESVMGALSSFEQRSVELATAMVPADESGAVTTITPDGARRSFYANCPEDAVAAAIPRLGPQPMATMGQATTASPLGVTPSTYVVCSQDEAVHPDHQAVMAARCDEMFEIDTDHSPFVSAIGELADVVASVVGRAR